MNTLIDLVPQAVAALREGRAKDAAKLLAVCSQARSLDYTVARLREHCHALEDFEALRQLGQILNGSQIRLRPLVAGWRFRSPETVYVIGSSLIRAYGVSPNLVPIFIGKGINCNSCTDESFAVMRGKYLRALQRLPQDAKLLLAVGIDASLLFNSEGKYLKQAAAELGQLPPEARYQALLPKIGVMAKRYAHLFQEACKLSGNVYLVLAPPTTDPFGSRLTRLLNDRIAVALAEHAGRVIDLWDTFADPATGLMDLERFGLPTILDDYHYREEGARLVLEEANRRGLAVDFPARERPFEWSHVFSIDAGLDEPYRIWCEPAVSAHNVQTSGKVAASFVGDKFAAILGAYCLRHRPDEIRWFNTHEAYVPLALPAEVVERQVLREVEPSDVTRIGALLDFVRRYDIEAGTLDAPCEPLPAAHLHCCIVPPQDEADRLDRLLATLRAEAPARLFLMARPPVIARAAEALGLPVRQSWLVGVKHLREEWGEFSVALLSRAADDLDYLATPAA